MMRLVTASFFVVLASGGFGMPKTTHAAADDRQLLTQAMKDRFYPIIEAGIRATCPDKGGSWHDLPADAAPLKGTFRRDSVAFCDSYIAARHHLEEDALIPWNAYVFYAYRRDSELDDRYVRLLVGPFLGRHECDAHRAEIIKSQVDVTLCKPVALD